MDKNLNILIFGSSGQICKTLISFLCSNLECNFFIVTREIINDQNFDIKRNKAKLKIINVVSYKLFDIKKLLNDVKPNIIIYSLAAGSVRAKNHSWETIKFINFTLPTFIAEWILFNNQKILYVNFGSTAEFSGYRSDSKISEDMLPSPLSDYAISKTAAFNKINSILGFNDNFKSFNLTLSSVYGGNEHKSRLIQIVYKALISNSQIEISDSDNKRDYVFLNDICECICNLITNFINNIEIFSSNERIFCASGYKYKNREVVKIMANLMKKNLDNFIFIESKKKYFSQSLNYSNNKFKIIIKKTPSNIKNLQIKDILS